MRKVCTFAKYYALSKLRAKNTRHENIRGYLKGKMFCGKKINNAEEINKKIYDAIIRGTPFFAGRFGANELSAVKTFDFQVSGKYDTVMNHLTLCAGFFPKNNEAGNRFKNLMIESMPEADFMGIWMLPFEDYYLKHYGSKQLETTYLFDLEPWSYSQNPWSSALKGKKVLVIHPFAETIEEQYAVREKIFPSTNILPKFTLLTLKAVQTVAGQVDERFDSWFDALDWMYEETMKLDFDIAILGCGAYGFPLAARLKKAGKQAIHLGGATQLLFGIKGRRWEDYSIFAYVQKYFNDSWVHPRASDKPKKANEVEGACYW